MIVLYFFFFKQKTAYDVRISDWSSDVCSSDLARRRCRTTRRPLTLPLRGALPLPASGARAFVGPSPQRGEGCEVLASASEIRRSWVKIGRASCRERVCQYV